MPHKDPETARAWRREWWRRSPEMRDKQNVRSRDMKAKINDMLRKHKLAVGCADCGFSVRGGERYMTKYQMIELCRKWLASRRMRVQIADREVHARRDARQGSFRK